MKPGFGKSSTRTTGGTALSPSCASMKRWFRVAHEPRGLRQSERLLSDHAHATTSRMHRRRARKRDVGAVPYRMMWPPATGRRAYVMALRRIARNTASANYDTGPSEALPQRGNVIWRVDITLIDLVFRNELVNIDRPRALNLNGLYFLIFNDHVLALCDFIAAHHVLARDNLADFGIDVLLFQPVAP
jgi:hypothetical protein